VKRVQDFRPLMGQRCLGPDSSPSCCTARTAGKSLPPPTRLWKIPLLARHHHEAQRGGVREATDKGNATSSSSFEVWFNPGLDSDLCRACMIFRAAL